MFDGWLKIDFDDMAKMIAKVRRRAFPTTLKGVPTQRGDKHLYRNRSPCSW